MNYKINSKEKFYLIAISILSLPIYMVYSVCVYGILSGLLVLGKLLVFSDNFVSFGALMLRDPYLLMPLYLFGIYLFYFCLTFIFMGEIKGNGVKITKEQFGDVYAILENHSQKLGLKQVPDMYVIEQGGFLNAFALKFTSRNYVVLFSSVLEAAYQEGKDAVSFIIGHELGHIARGHVSLLKSYLVLPAKFLPFLGKAYSRSCEYTCDNIGYSLCPQGALSGLLILATGGHLYTKVNVKKLIETFKSESKSMIFAGELLATHPALAKRIESIYELGLADRTLEENKIFTSPKVEELGKQEIL